MPTITGNRTYVTLVAAGTTQGTSGSVSGSANLTNTIGPHLLTTKVTNGATGPTVGCSVTVFVSGDNTNWKTFVSFIAQTANAAVTEFPVEIPAGTMYVEVTFSGNTVQSVTVEAFLQQLTSFTSA